MKPPDRVLGDLLTLLPAVDLQNRLLRISDRELALSMSYLREGERARVLSHVSQAKARRIEEELGLQARLAIQYKDYLQAIAKVVAALQGRPEGSGLRSWLRPVSRRRR